MAENPYDRTDVLRRDAWDEGFAAGVAAGREETTNTIALSLAEQAVLEAQKGEVRAAAVLDAYAFTLSCANAENAAIRAGEVRG